MVFLPNENCPTGNYKRAAVAADSERCSDIGRDMLRRGGSAVDAAIAALICTSLVNPQSMGLGGGSIFTIMDKAGKVTVFSSRETVPKSFKQDLLKDCMNGPLFQGPQWIGVPGELRGYQEVHGRYGKLPWAELFQPSIQLAREGFPMPPYLADFINHPVLSTMIMHSPVCRERILCHANNTLFKKHDTLRYTKLADTMETIAKEGADAFYMGSIAKDLIEDVKAAGGSLSLQDLESFTVRESEAIDVPMGEYTMHIPPLPAGGAILTFILNILRGFSLSPDSMRGEEKQRTFQRMIEAYKFANGQKRLVQDPYFHKVHASHLLDGDFAARIRSLITSDSTHDASYYNVTPSQDNMGTTHVSVIAEDGSAVSVTSTINQMFGSLVYSKKTGIILNNELADFCGRATAIKPGEQPPSSMAPVILRSKSLDKTLVIGGSGGSLITSAMAQAMMNYLWMGMGLDEAISAPIVFVDHRNQVSFESHFNKTLKSSLLSLGHTDGNWQYFLNVVNAVTKERGCIHAVSDIRKGGKASGY